MAVFMCGCNVMYHNKISYAGSQQDFSSELVQYAVLAIQRVEHKLEEIEVNQSNFERRLGDLMRKQEMVLTKQDQIQSTLHGDTEFFQSPTTSVLATSVTPPLTSPTSSIMAHPPVISQTKAVAPASSFSDVTSILDDCDLESLLSIDWSPPPVSLKPKKEPPRNLRPEGGPPVTLQHGASPNMSGERGPLTEFLTTGVFIAQCWR